MAEGISRRSVGEEIASLSLERQLDGSESMMDTFGEPETAKRLGGNAINTVGQVFEVESDEPLTEALVNRALHLLGQRHPLFRMRIVTQADPKTGKNIKYYSEIAEEKVYATCERIENDDWDEVFATETNKFVFSNVGPLCRTLMLPSRLAEKSKSEFDRSYKTVVIFIYHHTILDGNTVLRLFDDFLTYLARCLESDLSELPEQERLPLLPQFTELVSPNQLRMSFRDKLKLITSVISAFKKGANPFSNKFGYAIDRDPDLLPATRIYPMVIQPDLTAKILSTCKLHNVTVNSAIFTASMIAISKIIQGGTLQSAQPIDTMFAVNTRRFTKPEIGPLEEHIGCFIQMLPLSFKVPQNSEENFWKLSKKIGTKVLSSLTWQNGLFPTRMHLYMANQLHVDINQRIINQFADLAKKNKPFLYIVFGMSNMGKCDFFQKEKPRPFELSATYSAAIGHPTKGTFYHNVCTFNKKMFWSVVYYTPSTNREQAQEFGKVITQTLEKAVATA